MTRLEEYRAIVGDEYIHDLYQKAKKLYHKHIVHINSTFQGGGVAEMLIALVPLMNDTGFDAGWRILHGNPDFFSITKKFHNGLQGEQINLSDMKKQIYEKTNYSFSRYTHLDHDCIVIHDPQPLPIIKFYRKRQPWIWRCHIDLSHPDPELWNFLKGFILKYDVVIISDEKYRKKDLPVAQRIIRPAIDPLSPKNMNIGNGTISRFLKKFDIPTDKPILTQISRFDKWKDPNGVIEVFKLVKEVIDCRLVLCGSMASDDPEALRIFEKIEQKVQRYRANKDIILLNAENNILVNVLQKTSSVIIQKSIKEGFGLTVTEALWKETPVVASNVGGIPLQIKDGENGFLLEPNDERGFANRIVEILENPDMARELGKKGKEYVRKNFLITRLLMDYLDLLREVLQ
ncbi:glycosyltransferase [Candidatus Sumerlaeota bacterium]|nr:glycosyltransferase [Candidatus Sumerlaeota bacterium]